MSLTTLPRPPRSRAVIGLLLALLVQGLFLTLLRIGHQNSGTRVATLLEFRLLADRPRNVEASKDRARKPYHPFVLPPNWGDPAPPPEPGVSKSLPTPPSPAPTVPGPPIIAGPAPLNLAAAERPASGPRPESMLSQMLNDPRSNSPKRTLESAIADAAGTLPMVTSVSTDGRGSTLIRQGSKCYRVTDARIKTIDPMNEASKGAAPAWGKCVND